MFAILSRAGLIQLRRRAIRRGVWFRKLTKLDRATVDLTILCVEKVRSPILSRVLATIACKIMKTLRSSYLEVIQLGQRLAFKVSELAESWGYHEALVWRDDRNFAIYLGLNAVSRRLN